MAERWPLRGETMGANRLLKKSSFVLRQAQHERLPHRVLHTYPVTLSLSKGGHFQQPAKYQRLGSLKKEVSLAEALDRVLNKGAVVVGEMTISVADIDLLYLGINLLLTSVETIESEFEKSYAKKLYEVP